MMPVLPSLPIYSIQYCFMVCEMCFILTTQETVVLTSPLSTDIASDDLALFPSSQSTSEFESLYITTESIGFSDTTETFTHQDSFTGEGPVSSTENTPYVTDGAISETISDTSTIEIESLIGSTKELSTLEDFDSRDISTLHNSTMSEETQTDSLNSSSSSEVITSTSSTIFRTLISSTGTFSSSQNTETTTSQAVLVTSSFGNRNELLILWGSVTAGIILIVIIITVILVVCKRRKKLVDLNHGISLDTSYVMFSAPSETESKDLDFDPIDLSHIYAEGTSVSVRPSAFSTLTFKRGKSKEGKSNNTSTEHLVTKTKVERTVSGPDVISSQIESNCLEEDNIEISTNLEPALENSVKQ